MAPEDFKPKKRSGQSTVVYGNKMYIFGGIFELTNELNDLVVFNFETKKFSSNSETHLENENEKKDYSPENSPGLKTGGSPMKRGKTMGST
jgi:N-acetylneuraminic acid mutarotase